MNILLKAQLVAKLNAGDQELQKEYGLLRSLLDDLCETAFHSHGTLIPYRKGELIDAPDSKAARYVAVLHMSRQSHQALCRLMDDLLPLMQAKMPSCTLLWKTEKLDFLNLS